MTCHAVYVNRMQTAPLWARFLTSLYQPLSTFNLVWFIFGNLWYIGSDANTCDAQLRDLTLSLVIIQYIVMFLPCIILIVSLPFACLCFPMFMRIVTMLNPGQQSQARGITQAQITDATRTVKWQPGMFGGDDDDNMCTITMEPYKAGDEVCVLPCEHHFSQSAINTWLRQHNTCPLCRQPIVAVGEDASARRAQGGDAGNTVAEADPQAGLQNVTTVQVAEAATRQESGSQYARVQDTA